MFSINRRIIPCIIVMLVLISSLSGCGGGVMSLIKVTAARAILPDKWIAQDSIVTILADVIGNGIKQVIAQIKKSGSSNTSPITLTLNDQGKYVGDYKPDTTGTAETTTYSVVVTATDASGNVASSTPTTFDVPPTPVTAETPSQ